MMKQSGGSGVKNLPAVLETLMQVPAWSLSWEEPLEKEMATHFNILARGIPWTEESGGYSPGGLKQLDMTK